MSDSLGRALLLSADMEHYVSCQDYGLVLKLKWHTVVVCSVHDIIITTLLSLSLMSPRLWWYVFIAKCC